MKCVTCNRELIFVRGKGWVHVNNNNSLVIMRCTDCGHEWGNEGGVLKCPVCGSDEIVDDHVAMPDYSGE